MQKKRILGGEYNFTYHHRFFIFPFRSSASVALSTLFHNEISPDGCLVICCLIIEQKCSLTSFESSWFISERFWCKANTHWVHWRVTWALHSQLSISSGRSDIRYRPGQVRVNHLLSELRDQTNPFLISTQASAASAGSLWPARPPGLWSWCTDSQLCRADGALASRELSRAAPGRDGRLERNSRAHTQSTCFSCRTGSWGRRWAPSTLLHSQTGVGGPEIGNVELRKERERVIEQNQFPLHCYLRRSDV